MLEDVLPSNRRKPQALRSARRTRTSRVEVKLDVITTCHASLPARKSEVIGVRRATWRTGGAKYESVLVEACGEVFGAIEVGGGCWC